MLRSRAVVAGACLIAVLATAPPAGVAADGPHPIVVADPHYGEVLFYFYQEDYFPAIVRLLAAQQQLNLDDHADEAELLLGGLYLSYGHHLEAADIFERLLADGAAPAIRDRTWFFLAKIWQQRGYLERAQKALARLSDDLPENLAREAEMLEARLFIDTGEYDRAIAVLEAWEGRSEWANYARFNLGVAMVRSGRIDGATEILDTLGRVDPKNEELSALRDKANLALGYALLTDEQPYAAKAPLQRVRLTGPFSNKALLGVGWADAAARNYSRALVPWMELRGRDLLDSAVQESMLAIPYALAKLDSISQAADHYLNAIEAFYEEANRIDRTIDRIESGDVFERFLAADGLDGSGWYWRLETLPDGPESRYLYHVFAQHQFQEGLKNYRDLAYLRANLDDWSGKIGVYRNMLDTRRAAYSERLPVVSEALARADLDALVDRKLEFDSVLKNIENSNDWLALASEHEFDLWGEISGLESSAVLHADIPEAEDLRRKLRLLKGVLRWRLEREFKERLWRIRRNLRQAGEALVETQRSRRQIDDSMRKEPGRFAELDKTVAGLAPRIARLQADVGVALAEQRAFLQAVTVGELRAQQQRLDTYTVQARFALAAIYDVAATTVGDAAR